MFRLIVLLCLTNSLLLGACSKLSTGVDRDTFICGPLIGESRQYLIVKDPSGRQLRPDELEFYSLDSRLKVASPPISSRGCIQLPHQERLLVKASGKPWIAKVDRSEGELQLTLALEQSLVANCQDGKRVNSQASIESLLDAKGVKDPYAWRISYRFQNSTETIELPFDPNARHSLFSKPAQEGERVLDLSIIDYFRDFSIRTECRLVVDDTPPVVDLDYGKRETTTIGNATFHKVDRSQRLQFSRLGNPAPNDLATIEYCAEMFSTLAELEQRMLQHEVQAGCSSPFVARDLQALVTPSNTGFWIVRYRAWDQAGNSSDWQQFPLLYYHGEELRKIESLLDQDIVTGALGRSQGGMRLIQQTLDAFRVRDTVLTTDYEKAQADRILRKTVPFITAKLPMFIELWRTPLGNQLRTMTMSPDGRQIALGFKDGSVKRLDTETSLPIEGSMPKLSGSIEGLVFDPGGKQLLSADNQGWMNVWDLDRGQSLTEPFRFEDGKATYVEFLPQDHQIVFGMDSGALRFMDTTKGPESAVTMTSHLSPENQKSPSITSLRLLDQKTLIASSLDGRITFWDLESKTLQGQPILAFPTETFASVDVHGMPDKKTLLAWASGPDLALPQLWDLSTRQKVGTPVKALENFGGFVFPKDGSFVAANNGAGYQILDTTDWSVLQSSVRINALPTDSLSLAEDGRRLALVSDRVMLSVWGKTPANGTPLITALRDGDPQEKLWLAAAAPNNAGTKLALAADIGIIQIHDLRKTEALQSFLLPDPDFIPESIAFSPDENSLVVGTRTLDCRSCTKAGHIVIIDVKSGETFTLPEQKKNVQKIAFVDNDTLLTAGGNIKLWRWSTRTELPVPAAFDSAKSFAIYDGGHKIAMLKDNEVQFWDLKNLVQIGASLTHNVSSNRIAVSESGRFLALADSSRFEVQIFDRESGSSQAQVLRGHEDAITDLLFQDEQTLVSSSLDSKIKVWNIPKLEEDLSFSKHTDFVMGLFKRTGESGFYSFSIDGTVRSWSIDFNQMRQEFCQEFGALVPEQCLK